MGLFSWCTADTKKSIAVEMFGYEGVPEKVYLLNPFGPAYEETYYNGYGSFAGEDVFELVAKWNAPEKCKDDSGNWLSKDKIRRIGIDLACYNEDHIKIKYPIKIVENLTDYESAGISPSCPFQGFFYADSLQEIKDEVYKAFSSLDSAKKAYFNYLNCKGNEEQILSNLKFDSEDTEDKYFMRIVAKDKNFSSEKVFTEIAKKGDIYINQELVNNPNITLPVLNQLEKKYSDDFYIEKKIKVHPNYV